MEKLLILTLSEITLKGKNKSFFVNKLRKTIIDKLKYENILFDIKTDQSKFLLFLVNWESDQKLTKEVLKNIIGLSWIYEGYIIEDKRELFEKAIIQLMSEKTPSSYRLTTKTYDKNNWSSSKELIMFVADIIKNNFDNIVVSLEDYDFELFIKVFNSKKVLIYFKETKGLNGIPSGTTGTGLVLLSGGIDSPVASFLMQARGLENNFVTFLTSITKTEQTISKIISIARKLNQFNSTNQKLFIVDISILQKQIKDFAFENYRTVLLRRAFIKIAEEIANKYEIASLIMGDSLGQVASQTLESQSVIGEVSKLIMFKPLIGLNKIEIIKKAINIKTYELSILEGEDTCSLFSPINPIIKPKLEKTIIQENRIINYSSLVEEIVENYIEEIELF